MPIGSEHHQVTDRASNAPAAVGTATTPELTGPGAEAKTDDGSEFMLPLMMQLSAETACTDTANARQNIDLTMFSPFRLPEPPVGTVPRF